MRLRESLFPDLWRATSPDGRTTYEVTVRGSEGLNPMPGMRLQRVMYATWPYWRWWLTHSRFSLVDLVIVVAIVRLLQQIT